MDIGWLAILKDLGVQPGHVLRRAGLPDDLLSRTRQGLSGEDYFRFWRALEAEASDAMFPLRLVETLSADSFNPPLFAALCSANLVQALQRVRYLGLYRQPARCHDQLACVTRIDFQAHGRHQLLVFGEALQSLYQIRAAQGSEQWWVERISR
ncbi:AraC family transcriptional regulator ligand-binding domain-containing protein, partial [Klebsiella aerogenes]